MAVPVSSILQMGSLSPQFPVRMIPRGHGTTRRLASNPMCSPLRRSWQPFLSDLGDSWSSCKNRRNLGFRHTHANDLQRPLTTIYCPSDAVGRSIERIKSATWAAWVSAQVPIWIALFWRTGPAFGEEITEQVNAEAETEYLVNSDGRQFISVLLLLAFIGLSLLTVGVIYLAVTEFLEKRERSKLLKEQEAKKKKEKKSGRVKVARSGPRGFGQRPEEEDD
eukprot:Gb_06443 [translate_table: standard]